MRQFQSMNVNNSINNIEIWHVQIFFTITMGLSLYLLMLFSSNKNKNAFFSLSLHCHIVSRKQVFYPHDFFHLKLSIKFHTVTLYVNYMLLDCIASWLLYFIKLSAWYYWLLFTSKHLSSSWISVIKKHLLLSSAANLLFAGLDPLHVVMQYQTLQWINWLTTKKAHTS